LPTATVCKPATLTTRVQISATAPSFPIARKKHQNKKITPKNLDYTLECECSICGKKLSLKDAFCCFEPNRKIKSGLHKGGLYSVFFCADCAQKHEHGLT